MLHSVVVTVVVMVLQDDFPVFKQCKVLRKIVVRRNALS